MTLYKYTFQCVTESAEKSVWRSEDESVPTKCPDDTSHTIDATSIRISEIVDENLVKVQEEITPTGGNFKAITRSLDINASQILTNDNVWLFNISALAFEFISDAENQGDKLEIIVGPDTIIGAITLTVGVNDTVINVSQTVIDNAQIGYKANLFDGVNTEELGYVLAIDKDAKTITTEKASQTSFLATTPTYVRINVYALEDYTIGKPGRWVVGESKIGGSAVPAGTIVRIKYYNNTAAAKNFTAQLEYLY